MNDLRPTVGLNPFAATWNAYEAVSHNIDGTQKNILNVFDYGAKNDGSTDDAAAIQAALTAANAQGGGSVWIPGTGVPFLVGTGLTIGANCSLYGDGMSSVLRAKNSANITILSLLSNTNAYVAVRDLYIDGNKTNQSSGKGIYFDNSGAATDSHITISNVLVANTKNDGVTLINTVRGMGAAMSNVYSYFCDGNGFLIQGSDGTFNNCVSEKAGLAGWQIGGTAAATHLTNCTGADAGQITPGSGHGFVFLSGRISAAGCFAQDNSAHGFWIRNNDTLLSGCMADSNSFANSSFQGSGFYVETSTLRTNLTGCHSLDRQGGSATQKYGYYLNGTSENVTMTACTGSGNISGLVHNASSGVNNWAGITTQDVARTVEQTQKATSVLAQNMNRVNAFSDLTGLTSTDLRLCGFVTLQGGVTYTSITFISGATAGATLANQWFALYDTSGNPLCFTADDTSTAWATATAKTLAISFNSAGSSAVTYTPSVDTKAWVGVMIAASTVPSLIGALLQPGMAPVLPLLGCNAIASLSTVASAVSAGQISVGGLVGSTKVPYAHLI